MAAPEHVTDEHRRAVIGDVKYEIRMTSDAARLLVAGELDDSAMGFVVEAGLLHARCVLGFYFDETEQEKHSDVRADWFSPGWHRYPAKRAFEEAAGVGFNRLRKQLNTRLMHISSERSAHGRPDLQRIAAGIDVVTGRFVRSLPAPWDAEFGDL